MARSRQLTLLLCLTLASPTPGHAAAIDDLAWMAGHWRSESDGSLSEEIWTAPEGGLMLGLHRDVRPGKRTFFEYLRIEDRDGVITYVAQPGGKLPTAFPMKAIEEERVTFENPDHDSPQRIIYWRNGTSLCARVEGTTNGEDADDEWCWEGE